jgi:VanZ family protein
MHHVPAPLPTVPAAPNRLMARYERLRFFRAPVLMAVALLVSTFLPSPENVSSIFPWQDKAAHLVGYGLFAWLIARASEKGGFTPFLIAVFYGMFMEGIQYFLPYRTAEIGDVAANALGALFALCLRTLIITSRSSRSSH